MAVTTEVQNGELHEGASASNKTAPSASGTQADEGHSGNPMSNGILPAAANELTNGNSSLKSCQRHTAAPNFPCGIHLS